MVLHHHETVLDAKKFLKILSITYVMQNIPENLDRQNLYNAGGRVRNAYKTVVGNRNGNNHCADTGR
jgi:hypothetical protein